SAGPGFIVLRPELDPPDAAQDRPRETRRHESPITHIRVLEQATSRMFCRFALELQLTILDTPGKRPQRDRKRPAKAQEHLPPFPRSCSLHWRASWRLYLARRPKQNIWNESLRKSSYEADNRGSRPRVQIEAHRLVQDCRSQEEENWASEDPKTDTGATHQYVHAGLMTRLQ